MMDSPEGYHCLLCYHQVPFDISPGASLPADFDTNYFLFNFLSISPSTTSIDFEELGPSLCHNCVVNLMAITRMLKRIDELRLQFKENLTKAFEESEKTLELDHFEDKFCNVRAALLRDLSLLKKHMEWAHSGGRIQCKLCEKTYLSDVSLLHAHMQIHSQKKHLCPICGQSFLRKEVLSKHQKTHDKTKKFFCEKCGAGFHMRGNLSQHLRMKKCRNDD